jgi:hypothetical protein
MKHNKDTSIKVLDFLVLFSWLQKHHHIRKFYNRLIEFNSDIRSIVLDQGLFELQKILDS